MKTNYPSTYLEDLSPTETRRLMTVLRTHRQENSLPRVCIVATLALAALLGLAGVYFLM